MSRTSRGGLWAKPSAGYLLQSAILGYKIPFWEGLDELSWYANPVTDAFSAGIILFLLLPAVCGKDKVLRLELMRWMRRQSQSLCLRFCFALSREAGRSGATSLICSGTGGNLL